MLRCVCSATREALGRPRGRGAGILCRPVHSLLTLKLQPKACHSQQTGIVSQTHLGREPDYSVGRAPLSSLIRAAPYSNRMTAWGNSRPCKLPVHKQVVIVGKRYKTVTAGCSGTQVSRASAQYPLLSSSPDSSVTDDLGSRLSQ